MAALRAVEAAVRLESFTAAARELNLTQSAISQAVRQFEDRAGVLLFRRAAGGLRATPEAKTYATTIAAAIAAIRAAGEMLRAQPRPLVVGIVRSLLYNWLTPRLADFVTRHSSIPTSIIGLGRDLDEAERCDVALIIADDGSEPEGAVRFAREELIAVAAPVVAARVGGLLEDRPNADVAFLGNIWPLWRKAAGVGEIRVEGLVKLREISTVLNAVLMGQGVGLIPQKVCGDAMARGELIRVSNITVDRRRSYWLLVSDHPASDVFITWLQSRNAD
ncbi:MAG: LysR family transcriptional regulator [Pseudomonadota bacterium]